MDRKTVEIYLAMGIDPNSVQKSINEFKKIQAQVKRLEQDAENLKKAINLSTAMGEDATQLVAELKSVEIATVKLRAQMNAGLGQGTVSSFEKAEGAARQYREELGRVRENAEKLEGISIRAGAAGLAILAAYQQTAQAYIEKTGGAESTGQKWLATSRKLEESQVRLGRVTADALNPLRENLAGALNLVAAIAEKSPQTAQAIATIGAGITGLGGVGGLISQGLRISADVSLLTAANLQKSAAQDMLVAAGLQQKAAAGMGASGIGKTMGDIGKVAMTAATVYLVGNIATDIANQINEASGQGGGWTMGDAAKAASPATIALLLAKLGTNALGWDKGSEGINELYKSLSNTQDRVLDLLGMVLPDLKSNRLRTLDGGQTDFSRQPSASPEMLELYADYQTALQERKAAEARHEQERTDLVNEQGAARTALTARYEASRTDILAQYAEQALKTTATFVKNEARIEQDYYNQRQQAAQRYGTEVARMEADHQKEMRRMLEDHEIRTGDLVASRDALGLVKAQREYELNRQRAEEDYQTQAARRSQDYAIQLRDMEANFARQRARRLQDYQEQQAEREADKAARLAKLEEQRKQELAEFDKNAKERLEVLEENQRKEMETLKRNENARERLLTAIAVNGMTQTQYQAQRLFQQFNTDFNKWLASRSATYGAYGGQVGPPKPPGYANGGYVNSPGVYGLAERGTEYVMNNFTTRAAERLMGQRLTQENILQALAGRRGGSTINLAFPGGLVTMPMLIDILEQNNRQFGDALAGALEM